MAEEGLKPEDAIAWAALGAASREKADRLLEEQTILVRLQAEELRREDRLRHWSLRVHHLSDVLKLTFEFAIAFILVAVVATIAGAVWNAAHDSGVVIDAFSVPPDLAAQGLTGEVVASKLLDRLSKMQSVTESSRASSSYSSNWGDDIKVQIPDTGISLGELNRYLHEWLGHETRIGGEVYRTSTGIAVAARTDGRATPVFEGRADDLDTLIARAADSVFRTTQPYRYAIYLRTSQILGGTAKPAWTADDRQALAIMKQLAATGTIEDRAWSYDGIGVLLLQKGNPYGAEAMVREAIAIKPDLDFYSDLARTEYALEHNEAHMDALRHALAAAAQGEDADMDRVAVIRVPLLEHALLAFELGDYSSASYYAGRIHALVDNNFVGISNFILLESCAGLHDPACARSTQRDNPASVLAQRWVALLLGDFQAAEREKVEPGSYTAAELLRRNVPTDALIASYFGDFKRAHALIDSTPLDCDLCLRARGRIDAAEDNWGGAGYWFARAAAHAPSAPFACTDWGAMLLAKGDLEGAIAKFEQANQKGPHFADPLEMWGEALVRENRSDLAHAKFEEANKYAPNWGRLHLKWGEALLWSGKPDEARKQFAVAAMLDLTPAEKSELARVKKAHG